MPLPKQTTVIVTRTKDRPRFLLRAIRSVLSQTCQDWLHIIVNDGGDADCVDRLVALHQDLYAGRVQVIHHPQSLGMQTASNAAIERSDSEFIVIHDDDDSWQPQFLQLTTDYLSSAGEDSTIQGVVTQTTQVLEEVDSSGDIIELRRQPYQPVQYVTLAEMRKRNLFAPIAFVYRRKVHKTIGLFRQEFDVLGDHDFNLRFLRHYDIGVVEDYAAFYHWRHTSMGNTVTTGVEKHRRALSRMKNVYQREFLDCIQTAVGTIDEIPMPPPPAKADAGPLVVRAKDPAPAQQLPDFPASHSFKLLSLDIFDTALLRLCDQPKNVFRMVQDKLSAEMKLEGFAVLREVSERLARQQCGGEVTLDVIYAFMGKAFGWDEATLNRVKLTELQLERQVLYANPGILALYQRCRQQGIPVLFVSDMYLDSGTLTEWLEEKGYAGARVCVSCEHGTSKHDGGLFNVVLKQETVQAGDVLHIGDNLRSDYSEARKAGLQAWHLNNDFSYQPWYRQTSAFNYVAEDTLSYWIMGMVRQRGTLHPWEQEQMLGKLGYEAAGPLYLSFIRWLLQQAKRDGIEKLILLGRDGYYWRSTLDVLQEAGQCSLQYAYMHASRKVLNFASFTGLSEVALDFLVTPNPSLTVADFINRTGLDATRYSDIIATCGFDSPQQVLTVQLGGNFLQESYGQQLRTLFAQLEPDLLRLFAQDRQGVLKELEALKFDPATCAIVDIGWLASSLRRFPFIIDATGKTTVTGYYFGTWGYMPQLPSSARLRSYFIDKGEPAYNEALIKESVNFIESLHSAPHPTLVALLEKKGKPVPVFAQSGKPGGFDKEQQLQLWQGAESFIRDMVPLLDSNRPYSDRDGFMYVQRLLKRLICEPSPTEIAAWGGLEHSEGFGSEVLKPLVQKVAPDMNGDALLNAYQGSNWKRGFLSALSTAQREFVINRTKAAEYKSYQDLYNDLQYKIREADDLWARNNRLQLEIKALKEQAGQKQELLQHWQLRANELEGHLQWKNQQAEELWAQQNAANHQAAQLQTQLAEARDTITGLHSAKEKLQGDFRWKVAQCEQLWAQQNELSQQVELMQSQLLEAQSRITDLHNAKEKLQGDFRWKVDQCEQLWAQHNEASHKLQATQNQLQETLSMLAESREQLHKLEGDLQWKNQQAHELWTQHNAAVHELQSMNAQLQDLSRQLELEKDSQHKMAAEMSTLAEAVAQRESAFSQAQLELNQLRNALMVAREDQQELVRLQSLMKSRKALIKILFSSK